MVTEPELKALEYEKYICTECYQFGAHEDVAYGSWKKYWIQVAIIFPIILIPSILYLCWLFAFYTVSTIFNKGLIDSHALIDPVPLWQYMPEKPTKVKTCPHCKKVNSQARIKDKNGQTAVYFHKKTGMHIDKQDGFANEVNLTNERNTDSTTKRKIDPDEF